MREDCLICWKENFKQRNNEREKNLSLVLQTGITVKKLSQNVYPEQFVKGK